MKRKGKQQFDKIYTNPILSVHMSGLIKIGKAVELLEVSIQTLRRWEELGTIIPQKRTAGGTRYYDLNKLLGLKNLKDDLKIAYARVSSHDQKQDLVRQARLLSTYCLSHVVL